MMLCSRCGAALEGQVADARCAPCDQGERAADGSSWATIARLSNLAEAGFFADWLEGEGITARVYHRHSFTAVHDVWNTTFELHVALEQAERAVGLLRETLAEEPAEDAVAERQADSHWATGLLAHSPLLWILVAGSLAYVLGRTSGAPPVPRELHTRLWHVVAESPPMFSEPRAGEPRRCLRYDADAREVVLEVDLDVDGDWDVQQRFAAAP